MLAISIIALVISLVALPFTAWAARAAAKQAESARVQARAAEDQTAIQREQVAAAKEQTQLQLDLARQASQPYVWADIQPDLQQGTMMHVVVGNSGPTMAQNVRVTFEPALPASQGESEKVQRVEGILAEGLRSLAPGREIRWTLGAGYDLLASDAPQVRSVRVEADGPAGALPVVDVEIDVSQWRQARDAPDGSLHHVRGSIKELTKAVGGVEKALQRAAARLNSSPHVEVIELDQLHDTIARRAVERPRDTAAETVIDTPTEHQER